MIILANWMHICYTSYYIGLLLVQDFTHGTKHPIPNHHLNHPPKDEFILPYFHSFTVLKGGGGYKSNTRIVVLQANGFKIYY